MVTIYKLNKVWTSRIIAVAAFVGDTDTTLHSASTTYKHPNIVSEIHFTLNIETIIQKKYSKNILNELTVPEPEVKYISH
jgi:hypothetical protein